MTELTPNSAALRTTLMRPVAAIPAPWRKPAGLLLLALLVAAFPLVDSNQGDIDAAANACAYILLALGLNIVVGFAGLLDLGYAAFFAIGAYAYGVAASWQLAPAWSSFWQPFALLGLVTHFHAAGLNVVHFNVSFWLMLPLSGLLAAAFGVAFGAPTLRLRGDYLAIVTLGFGEIVPIVARNWPQVTNGAMGLNGVAAPSIGSYSFSVFSTPYYYLGVGLVALGIFVSLRLRDSRMGRAWLAIREDEIAAGASGINRTKLKLTAFATGACFAGIAGTFFVAKLQTATPDMFMFPVSVMVLVMVVFGGMGSVWGVVLGAAILQLLQSWLLQDLTHWIHVLGRAVGSGALQAVDLTQWIELIFGVILVLMMLYRRDGLIPAGTTPVPLSIQQQTIELENGGITLDLAEVARPPEHPKKPMLELRGLVKRFGGLTAVDGLDLTVPAHSVVGLIGPNGSGKTTTFNLISGLDRPDGGTILLDGAPITGLASHQVLERGLSRTFQTIRLFPNLTVLENVMVGAHTRTRAGLLGSILRPPRIAAEEEATREWALQIISIFGNRLLPRLDHRVSTLSYANRRRVEIARALVSRPKLLLLDEPMAGMNPAETRELASQIKSLKDFGLTILLIEHKMDVVEQLADKVVVLDHGEKVCEGSAEEVRANPDVISAYLGRTAAHA